MLAPSHNLRPLLLAVAALALLPAAPALAQQDDDTAAAEKAPPLITSMIVGKDRILGGMRSIEAPEAKVRVGKRRCVVGANTALAVLVARGTRFRLTDHGRCGDKAADASGLYVERIGPDQAGGQAGWVYKVGRKVATTGAADPSGPFGTGKRLGERKPVLWFWCVSAGACQRTLEIKAPAQANVDDPFTVTVRGYDDQGKGVPVEGATLTVGATPYTTDAQGRATVTAAAAGRLTVRAAIEGMVDAFPRLVTVK